VQRASLKMDQFGEKPSIEQPLRNHAHGQQLREPKASLR
jgi:hypothetical protein